MTTENLAPVITVDWEAVEADTGRVFGNDLRRVVEHVGGTTELALDKWGYGTEATTALFTAVKDYGRVFHLGLGALDPRYAPLRSMSAPVSVLRKLRGEDLRIGTIIDDGDDEEYIGGLADLYDAARELDERRDDWREDQHPTIAMGSYGPDQLGNLFVYVGHADQSVIEGINVEGLPVEREQTLAHGRNRRSAEEYYTATSATTPRRNRSRRSPTNAPSRSAFSARTRASARSNGTSARTKSNTRRSAPSNSVLPTRTPRSIATRRLRRRATASSGVSASLSTITWCGRSSSTRSPIPTRWGSRSPSRTTAEMKRLEVGDDGVA